MAKKKMEPKKAPVRWVAPYIGIQVGRRPKKGGK